MTKFGVVVGVALAAAIGVGIALFPRALEPGSSESNGIVLNLLFGNSSAGEANDWYEGQAGEVVEAGAELAVRGGPLAGLQLISRPLPVYPHRHYVLVVRGRATTKRVVFVKIANDDATRYFGEVRLPYARAARTVVLRILTRGEGRLSVVFAGPARTSFAFSAARLKLVH